MGIHNENLLMKLKNCPKFVSELCQQPFCLGTDIVALGCTRYTRSIRVCCHQQDWSHSTCYPTITCKITNIYIYQQTSEFHWATFIASSELVSQYYFLAMTLNSPYNRHQPGKVLYLLQGNTITTLTSFIYTQFVLNSLPSIHTILHVTNKQHCYSCKCFVYTLQLNFPLMYSNTLCHGT